MLYPASNILFWDYDVMDSMWAFGAFRGGSNPSNPVFGNVMEWSNMQGLGPCA